MTKYLVLAIRTSNFQHSAIESHHAFLQNLRESGQLELSGPFTDGTGGAYLLNVESLEEARAIAQNDPLHITGSSNLTVYEWKAH